MKKYFTHIYIKFLLLHFTFYTYKYEVGNYYKIQITIRKIT